jgi:hypothetical protein
MQVTCIVELRALIFLREISKPKPGIMVLAEFGAVSAPIVGGSAENTLIWWYGQAAALRQEHKT